MAQPSLSEKQIKDFAKQVFARHEDAEGKKCTITHKGNPAPAVGQYFLQKFLEDMKNDPFKGVPEELKRLF